MLGSHKKAVIQFSGGKDSLAVLLLARKYLDQIEVHFCDTGAQLPEVVSYIVRTCRNLGAKLVIVRPNQDIVAYQEERGLPSDVVPVWATKEYAWTSREKPKTLIQSTVTCCTAMLFAPLHKALVDSGATLVLRGAKFCDEQRGVAPGFADQGIEYAAPIWDWSDDDVFAYLEAEGAEIPAQYAEVNSSLDCWLCTGHTHASNRGAQFNYLRKHRPDLWPALESRLTRVRDAIRADTASFDAVLEAR